MWIDRILDWLGTIRWLFPALLTIVAVLGTYLVLVFFLHRARNRLLAQEKNKRRRTNIKGLFNVIKFALFIIVAAIGVFSYKGEWTGLGLSVGLLTAALGFALQKPITSIAAWFMIITRHPYDLGDRIIVGNVKGDVIDITVMHTYLAERGGMEGGEERSGRIALLPNSVLFDENVINYSKDNDFVLDRVMFKVTYESDVDAAVGIALDAARKETASYNHKGKDAPFTRIAFCDSGVDVKVRYLVNFSAMQDVRDRVTRRVFKAVIASKKVNFAYPHVELVMPKGSRMRSRAKPGRHM